MKWLVDTNVISALAPTRADRPRALVEGFDRYADDLSLSVVTAAEIRDGVAKAEREGASRKARALREWWETVEHLYADRILPFDLAAATLAGELMDLARAAGHAPGFADVAIAATALSRDLTILTRNVKHFQAMTNRVVDPFGGSSPWRASEG